MRDNGPVIDEFGAAYWRQLSVTSENEVVWPPGASTEELHRFANNLPVLCWMARADGYIVWYNRRWHDYCGTTHAQMEGWGWQSVHDPDELPEVTARWQSSIESGQPFEMVFPLRGADGIFRPFLTRIVPFRGSSGKIERWFGVNAEIGAQLRAEKRLKAVQTNFEVLTNAMPQLVWSTTADGSPDYYNQRWYDFTGVAEGETHGDNWTSVFHPEDQAPSAAKWQHAVATGEPYEVEYRLRHKSGQYRWVLGRALPVRDGSGAINRWIGTCTDIDDAKRAADHYKFFSQELTHRIKNIFAIVVGFVRLTGRKYPQMQPLVTELVNRILALGRAHDLARLQFDITEAEASDQSTKSTLHGIIHEILAPYPALIENRISVRGDDLPVDDRGATPIALTFHELGTNAMKYGALSVDTGSVEIATNVSESEIELIWSERGGPPIVAPPDKQGFGTQLTDMSINSHLSGTIHRQWNKNGLIVSMKFPRDRLSRTKPAGEPPARSVEEKSTS